MEPQLLIFKDILNQLQALVETESDKDRQLQLTNVINSLKKVGLGSNYIYVVTRSEEHADYVERVFLTEEDAEAYCEPFNSNEDVYPRDVTPVKLPIESSKSNEQWTPEDEKMRDWLLELLAHNYTGSWEGLFEWFVKLKSKSLFKDVIYYPLKCGEKYEPIPYSFCGSIESFSNPKDLMDFLHKCFYDRLDCQKWCDIENNNNL